MNTSRPLAWGSIPLLVVTLALLGGCGGTEGDPDGSAGGDAGTAACAEDVDCADGRFCNGVEVCDPESAAADARGCVPGNAPCPGGSDCIEAESRCGSCDNPDADDDGHDAIGCGGDDCDDTDDNRFPGNPEVCDDEGHDEDCVPTTFGERDGDEDGAISAACCNQVPGGTAVCGDDCDDANPNVRPTVPEVCNGVDDDCSGAIDDGPGFTCQLGETQACDPADGPAGQASCQSSCMGFGLCRSEDEGPTVDQSCNGVDDDGDDVIDENFTCARGAVDDACTTACGTPGARQCEDDCSGFGACLAASEMCNYCDDDGVNGAADETPSATAEITVDHSSDRTPAGSAGGLASPGSIWLHDDTDGFAASSLFATDPIPLGYEGVTFRVNAFASRTPCDGTAGGGFAVIVARAAGAAGSVGTRANFGIPSGLEGYAATWSYDNTLCNVASLSVLEGASGKRELDVTTCTSVGPLVTPQLRRTSSGDCYANQTLVLTVVPDIPGTAVNEMRVRVADGTGLEVGVCTGDACPVLLQAGDLIDVGASGAGASGDSAGASLAFLTAPEPPEGTYRAVSAGLCP